VGVVRSEKRERAIGPVGLGLKSLKIVAR
jgi:hypothetical protein